MSETMFFRHHFAPPSSHAEQRDLFAVSVSNVVIEISSYCNRKCNYCPISTVDRASSKKFLSEDLFWKIVHDLESISYSKGICLNLYNEPTATPALLLERIRYARSRLLKSNIYFSTNGDFLSKDYIRSMVEAGLSTMYVTLHPPKGAPYRDEYSLTRFCELSKRLGKTVQIRSISPGHTIQGDFTLFGMLVHVFSTNYELYGSDRAGSVALAGGQVHRTAPCERPFQDFTISYDGTIFPCCQMFADNHQHRASFAIGNLSEFPDIFSAYASHTMAGWRRQLVTFGPKNSPCDNCSENNRSGIKEERLERERIYRQLVDPTAASPVIQRALRLFRLHGRGE